MEIFWLDWKQWSSPKVDHVSSLTKDINMNRKLIHILNSLKEIDMDP